MSRFLEALRSGKVILMDGAMGTELMRVGWDPNTHREEWNLRQPETVQRVHRAYLHAGAQVLLTNTFQAHAKCARYLEPRPQEIERAAWSVINQRALWLARAAGVDHFVLGDVGPPLAYWGPDGSFRDSLEVTAEKCLQQMEWLAASDAVFLETQPSWEIAREIVRTIIGQAHRFRAKASRIVSFAFANPAGQAVCASCSPETIGTFVDDHRDHFVALGVNCGRDIGMDEIIDIVRRYRTVTDLPILARPNAGTPKRVGNEWVYPETPARMAARLPELIDAGATLIGGCCGTTPEHIAAFREVIDQLGVGWTP